jgi:G-protein alpha subunit
MDPRYQPTMTDIVRAPEHLRNLRETKLTVNDLRVDLIEVPQCKLRRIIHQFDQVDACLFSLDLSSYDVYGEDSPGCNRLEQSLRFFKAIARSGHFACTPIFLCCVNFKELRRKLATSPLSIHFPNYAGVNDATAVAKFVLERCQQVVTPDQDLFHHVAEDDAEDQSTIRFFEEKAASLPATACLNKTMGFQSASYRLRDRLGTGYRSRLLSSPD